MIRQPPTHFNLAPFADRWFGWMEIQRCFWPGVGKPSMTVDPLLAAVRHLGGIYLMAWSAQEPGELSPRNPHVRYVGETGDFRHRMGCFGNSAGFWGPRTSGHSAAWRWPEARKEHLTVAFFPVGADLPSHLATGLRSWMEAVALEEYRVAYGSLPRLNLPQRAVIEFD